MQGRPIHLRRYSDDPFLSVSTSSAPGSLIDTSSLHSSHPDPARLRAVSVNDAAAATIDWERLRPARPPTPDINLTLASPRDSQHPLDLRVPTPDLLALPTPHSHPNLSRPSPTTSEPTTPLLHALPHLTIPTLSGSSDTSSPRFLESPRTLSPLSRSASPPASLHLPPPAPQWRTIPHWPYTYLPPPQLLSATLFPTLQGWPDKTFLEKALALIALLPVFLLTITLPVVETTTTTTDPSNPIILEPNAPPTRQWNRWLVALQCLTAPTFMVIMFAFDPSSPHTILKPLLWALVAGLTALAALLAVTREEHAPEWRWALCFCGFAVSIGWISGVANEVVGVLKAFGVILGISDAILGLTIFAVVSPLFILPPYPSPRNHPPPPQPPANTPRATPSATS